MTIVDDAIILSRERWREADKRVCFFTRTHGKVTATAVGAAKIRSKLSGHLEPLRRVRVMFAVGARGWKVAQAATEESFVSSDASAFAGDGVARLGRLARLVEHTAHERNADAPVFDALLVAFRRVSTAPTESERAAASAQSLRELATHFGYAPVLDQCASCGEHTLPRDRFSVEHGGVICRVCQSSQPLFIFDENPLHQEAALMAHARWHHLL